MKTKLKINLLNLENTIFYFVVGMLASLVLPYEIFQILVLFMIGAAVVEALLYKHFVAIVSGSPSDEELFSNFVYTLLAAFSWFFMGYVFAKVVL